MTTLPVLPEDLLRAGHAVASALESMTADLRALKTFGSMTLCFGDDGAPQVAVRVAERRDQSGHEALHLAALAARATQAVRDAGGDRLFGAAGATTRAGIEFTFTPYAISQRTVRYGDTAHNLAKATLAAGIAGAAHLRRLGWAPFVRTDGPEFQGLPRWTVAYRIGDGNSARIAISAAAPAEAVRLGLHRAVATACIRGMQSIALLSVLPEPGDRRAEAFAALTADEAPRASLLTALLTLAD